MISNKDVSVILERQSLLKQDVYENTKERFADMKRLLEAEVVALRKEIPNERVRLSYIDKGDFEVHIFAGSDLLVFHMHTNVFCFPDEHPIWKTSYVSNNADRAYCGVINVYNFLADSFLHDRFNDSGYLIGRMFINKENHFIIEGNGDLGIHFRDFVNGELNEEISIELIRTVIKYAAEFDLLVPPYDMVNNVSVGQMKTLSSSLQMKTAKRLGFKFSNENDEII
jgi:hypothetical protein